MASEQQYFENDGRCGETTRKLPVSFDKSSSAPPSSKKKLITRMDEYQFEFEEEPCRKAHRPIPVSLKEGDVVSIPRSEGEVTVETPLYIRQHIVDKLQEVKEKFEDTKLLHMYATGAPGCGKTCFFWMWAIMKMQEGKSLLFIQYRREPSIWVLEKYVLKRITAPRVERDTMVDIIVQLLNQQTVKFDFAILDGVRHNDIVSVALMDKLTSRTGVRKGKQITKSVFVTSLQFKYPLGYVCRGIQFNEDVDIAFDSWKESDYHRAVQSTLVENEAIRSCLLDDLTLLTSSNDSNEAMVVSDSEDERLKHAVQLKYRYAGGCVRFMFDFELLRLKQLLDDSLGELKQADWEELCSTSVSDKAAIAVDSLMQRFAVDGGTYCCSPVSEYVLRHAYDVCRSKLTLAVSSAADKTTNPLLLDWAFEMGELDKLDIAQAANSRPAVAFWRAVQIDIVPSNTTDEKRRDQRITFCPQFVANYKNGKVLGLDVVRSGTVIRCDIWNQGCFDVAFYMHQTLVTLQVTMAKYHSLKLSHLTDLRNALLKRGVVVDDVVHVAILNDANVESFHFAPAITDKAGRYLPISRDNQPTYGVKVVKARELQLISVPVGAPHTCNIHDMVFSAY